jgi:TP901 family phage tail tape measure protein
MASSQYDLSVILRVLDKATGPLQKVGRAFEKLKTPVNAVDERMQKLGKTMKHIGDRMGQIGRNMSLKFTLPFSAAVGLSLKASMDFNKSMANVATLIPHSIDRVNQLKTAIQEMALKLGISTSDLAGGLYQVISYMGDGADTAKILEINAMAAKAGLSSVTDAVNLTSAVMKGYNDTSAEMAQKTADLAFQTVKLGATTFPELAESMRGAIAWAGQLNVPLEDLFATFATLTGVTGSTAEVGTQMEAVMRGLVKTTPVMAAAIKYLGYTSAKTMIHEIGLSGALKKLNELTKGSEEAMTQLFGRAEPLMAVFALTGKLAGTFVEKLEAMRKSSRAMREAFLEQTEGINKAGFAWERFKVRISLLREEIGDALAPAFEKILKLLSPLVTWFAHLNPKIILVAVSVGALVAALGAIFSLLSPLISAFAVFTMAMSSATAAGVGLGAIAAGFTALLAPVLAVSAAIGGIGAAIYEIQKHWDVLKNTAEDIYGWGKGIVTGQPEMTPEERKSSVEEALRRAIARKAERSETEVNIHVSSDSGATATIESVKKKRGDAQVSASTVGYVGIY